jgi:hypothetical protein
MLKQVSRQRSEMIFEIEKKAVESDTKEGEKERKKAKAREAGRQAPAAALSCSNDAG